ncbi:helix-turn-helix domain-containing protein [Bradyrhizobium sp. LA2.1]|uniref:AraC family transcriptional regulator n=1 Tax=Bradyrhizobium sp. LA2.1 TaxID=3156376 RepID=UPI003399D3D0
MKSIVLARCALLVPFVDVLDDIGAPAERMLARFGLPAHPEQRSNDYFPLLPAVQFAATVQASQGLTDFGFRAVQRLQLCHLSEQFQVAARHAPTLLAVLEELCRFVQLEDNFVRIWLERHADDVGVCSAIAGTSGMPHLEHSQWVQNVMPIYVVRHFAGPDWAPATIAFEAIYTPDVETQACWPRTRFRSGQKSSWIDVPVSLLSLRNPNAVKGSGTAPVFQPIGTDVVSAIKLMLPSYLGERMPDIAELAEMARTSVRSLQRELAEAGLTYLRLLDHVRFERAAELMRKTDAKIIDVALATGYTDPAHFTRAFRRMAGITPREFRDRPEMSRSNDMANNER